MRKYSKFILFFLFTIILLFIVELSRPKEINWGYSFSKDDTIPFGSFIIYKLLPEIFPPYRIITADYPVYNILKENEYENANYIFINYEFFPDELDTEKLLAFVKNGNNVFISANFISGKLADSLKFMVSFNFPESDSILINFSDDAIKNQADYIISHSPYDNYFSSYDTTNSVILGVNEKNNPNFISMKFGKGNIYLNTVPLVFTNYNMLDSLNSDYIYKAISYLPENRMVLWDEYYKINKTAVRTPIRYILNQESLRWAYYLLIFSIVFYIIFLGRRKQRIIPVKKPLTNTTLEFVNTVGRLYYHQKDHKNIAEKKIIYFLDQVRNRYFIKTDEINDEILEKISSKSGVNIREVKSIFTYIKFIEMKNKISEEELFHINNLIESFYKKAGIHG